MWLIPNWGYGFKRATGINFTCVLRSQRLRKIHPSSAMTFLECIDYIRVRLFNAVSCFFSKAVNFFNSWLSL